MERAFLEIYWFYGHVILYDCRPVSMALVMWAIKRKGPWGVFWGFVGDGMLPSYISIVEKYRSFFFVAPVVKSRELWNFGRNPSFLFGSLGRCVAKNDGFHDVIGGLCLWMIEWLKDSRSVLSKTFANGTSRSTISQCLKNHGVMLQNCC